VHLPPNATPATLGETYDKWSKTWRSNPHELKIALRRWIDIEEVQSIVNTHPPAIQKLFNADTLKPAIQKMLTSETADMSLLEHSLARAWDWKEMRYNRTLQDVFHSLNFKVMRHKLALEQLDSIGVLHRQNEVLEGDDTWFVARKLTREFEDLRLSLGKQCDDGSHVVNGYCVPWAGTCENGKLLEQWDRKADDECGSCNYGYILLERKCVAWTLHEKVITVKNHDGGAWDGAKSIYLADRAKGYICALQSAGVEDLAKEPWSTSTCKVYPEFGRVKLDAVVVGPYTDAECGSACLETPYPVTKNYYVKRNEKRERGVTGVTKEAMISTKGSVCWLSMVSFWQATHRGDWAECSVKANKDKMWEVRASVNQKSSKTGSECGAVCMSQLPKPFKVEDEVIKHWDRSGCQETVLGPAANRTCFLSSMAVSHAHDWQERPRCDVEVVGEEQSGCCGGCHGQPYCSPQSGSCYAEKRQPYYETCASYSTAKKTNWLLRTCNGWRREAETMCGVRCVHFTAPATD
jgi:hypothetical protein